MHSMRLGSRLLQPLQRSLACSLATMTENRGILSLLLLASICSLVQATFPPPPVYSRVLTSPLNPNISISVAEPSSETCKTVFSTQKQYTGYISLPPFTLAPIQQNYSINTFFWFVEARTNSETAPLTVWMNGGPGM